MTMNIKNLLGEIVSKKEMSLEVLKKHGDPHHESTEMMVIETAIILERAQFRQVTAGHPGLIRDGLMGFAGLAIFIVGMVAFGAMVLEAVK